MIGAITRAYERGRLLARAGDPPPRWDFTVGRRFTALGWRDEARRMKRAGICPQLELSLVAHNAPAEREKRLDSDGASL